jgi:hypothetical protein
MSFQSTSYGMGAICKGVETTVVREVLGTNYPSIARIMWSVS